MKTENKLRQELEDAIQQLEQKSGGGDPKKIHSIILINLEQGRVENWLGTGENRAPQDYVHLVAGIHEQYSDYINKIQIERSENVWPYIYTQLQQWAYNYLLGKGFYRNQSTYQLAGTYATEAAIALLKTRFPYDRNFEPWAHVILLNVCKRQIRYTSKKSHIPDEKKVSLNDNLIKLHNQSPIQDTHEIRLSLLDAIENLSEDTWQQVLLLRYFHNLTPAEIAEELGKTPSAVYNLHFKALTALRKIWSPKGHIHNEKTVE